jgi:hypothetical protein
MVLAQHSFDSAQDRAAPLQAAATALLCSRENAERQNEMKVQLRMSWTAV